MSEILNPPEDNQEAPLAIAISDDAVASSARKRSSFGKNYLERLIKLEVEFKVLSKGQDNFTKKLDDNTAAIVSLQEKTTAVIASLKENTAAIASLKENTTAAIASLKENTTVAIGDLKSDMKAIDVKFDLKFGELEKKYNNIYAFFLGIGIVLIGNVILTIFKN
jgi:hypothetical protein